MRNAKLLNSALNREFVAEQKEPIYFTGKFDAKTVFIMLNPGGSSNDTIEEFDKSKYNGFDDYFDNYINKHINYGSLDRKRSDNFDLKQAAFLYDFKNSGLNLPNIFSNKKTEKDIKLIAKENVLMNKLQLELIPYYSVEFNGLFDNKNQAMKNIDIFLPYITRILDAIILFDRTYVVFGAKQFTNLFIVYKEKKYGNVELGELNYSRIDEMKNRVSWNTIKIEHKGRQINAIIANSFPRRDLPNAFDKMRKYGNLCYQEFINTFSNK